MYCPNCGTRIEDNQRYCPSCGEMLDAGTEIHEHQKVYSGFGSGAVSQISSAAAFLRNNLFRIIIAAVMVVLSIMMLMAFIDEYGLAFSILSGLEKKNAAVCACIYTLAVFIPILLSLESIREIFFISARVKPKEFNIRGYAINKRALLPITIDFLACLALAIVPLILYNYKENDIAVSLAVILEGYRMISLSCCGLCIVSALLIAASRRKIKNTGR